ncbi:META domain-containing protein [Fusobacterium perfoetens]|uniref:META domain-containing protein n=1 Tax=Fusobacterium perfoetens TaxID=852 RepID=UPI00048634FF|nr:META domain-containing protein [Fusobacterium perfoetens]MCI6151782.1 META domain-containing protein [Fusobacterium perfoetens]MDY3236857.1 META domain-containing protein [Fusobacterium perfoetens]
MKKIFLGLLFLLSLMGCTNSMISKNENLVGKQYVLVQQAKDYQITLNFAENNFFGFAGVNNYFGKYEVQNKKITFGAIGRTMMAGPQEIMKVEDEFLSKVEKSTSYEITKDELILMTDKGEKLIFKLVETPKK